MRLALCLLVILAVASATTKFNLDYSKKRSMTAVMAEVEAKLKNKSPLDAILNVLRDFRDAVNTEQVNHDEIYNIQVTECESEDAFRRAEVTDASNVLRDSTAALNVAQTSKIRATNQQEVNQQQYFSAQEHLNSVLSAAETEAGYFKRRGRDYEDALHAIDEASDILATIYSGSGSFAEISRVSKSMLQTAFNIKETAKFAPVFYAFSQLAAQEGQLDESALERVAQLLETLRGNIQEAYNDFTESNAVSVAAFNDQKDRIGQTLARLEAQNERLQNKLDSLNQQIGTQSAIAQTASGKLQRNQQLWDQAQALCSTFANEYNYATQARRNEIQLVAQLEEMVEARFNQVEDENHERNQRLANQA
ncbi:unnamed protein product [Paramecium primaurelia]|uniref:Trichocyst matrix protein n=2 Tax=Paramecium TaxID=5884 RepID=A0A8S1WD24_9CILI|nr:unnamed protein product [Paramecium primaurelia]CAD8186727.1 unnamed protein product [Paramecium pentaurelia]